MIIISIDFVREIILYRIVSITVDWFCYFLLIMNPLYHY